MPARLVERAQIVQMAASGVQSQEIARVLEVSRPAVQLWRHRFLGLRLAGLEKDAPRPGRIPKISNRNSQGISGTSRPSKASNITRQAITASIQM
jgi:transposase